MSTQRSQPAAPLAPEGVDDESVSEQVSSQIFNAYVCRSITDRGVVHPGDVAEPTSLSSILLPTNTYPLWDSIGERITENGKLSRLQLEGVRYACSKHLEILPTKQRAGFFIGDGAGVGKGRQISGIILDNYARGRTKSIWVSTSSDLHQDACRDISDLGMNIKVINNCADLDSATRVGGLSKDYQEGVLFLTYSTLVSAGKAGRTRLQQVLDWAGSGFEGCLIFDECHRAKNFAPGKEAQSTKVAATVIELQRQLPRARVVYCSATGVSEVGHMAYLERMGLWGAGSAFVNFEAFIDSMKNRGVSFLEMLAMELKSEGKYVARGLSFRDAEFVLEPCQLDDSQITVYNATTEIWHMVRVELANAITLTGSNSNVWRVFWSAQQRFFKLLCVSLKMPAVIATAKAALDAGQCVVVGLQSTGESATDSLGLQHGQATPFVSTVREILRRFLLMHFPTARNTKLQQNEARGGAQAAKVPERADPGSETVPVSATEFPELVAMRDTLVEQLSALDLPNNFLDVLVDELGGPGGVAEMTGRSARIIRQHGRTVYATRGKADCDDLDSLNIQEKDDFLNGKKLVAIISDAASTGVSLHAVRGVKNQRRRVHITIELPWSADKAIQQLGRSHRSNQTSAPLYKLVVTNVGGETRFAAAVARRLQSLGALTRGDRRAASGIDLSDQNLDTPLGRGSLRTLYELVISRSRVLPPGVSLQDVVAGVDVEAAELPKLAAVQRGTDLSETEQAILVESLHAALLRSVDMMGVGSNVPHSDTVAEDTVALGGKSAKELGDVRRFLNRILGLPIHQQNLLFNYFCAVVQADIKNAKQEGRYIEGMSDLPASHISRACKPEVLWVDPHSGLKTMKNQLRVDRGVSFEEAKSRLANERSTGDRSGFYQSQRPIFGRTLVLLAVERPGQTSMFAICRPNTGLAPTDMERIDLNSRYTPVSEEAAEALWTEIYDDCLEGCVHGPGCPSGKACAQGRRISQVTLLSGSVVRVWGVLEQVLKRHEHVLNKADRAMRIIRVDLQDEGTLVGVRYRDSLLPEVVTMLSAVQMIAKGASAKAAEGAGAFGQSLVRQAASLANITGMDTMHQVEHEAPTPVVPRLHTKLFRPPRTLASFWGAPASKKSADAAPSNPASNKRQAASGAAAKVNGIIDVSALQPPAASKRQKVSGADQPGASRKQGDLVVDLCDSTPATPAPARGQAPGPDDAAGVARGTSSAEQAGVLRGGDGCDAAHAGQHPGAERSSGAAQSADGVTGCQRVQPGVQGATSSLSQDENRKQVAVMTEAAVPEQKPGSDVDGRALSDVKLQDASQSAACREKGSAGVKDAPAKAPCIFDKSKAQAPGVTANACKTIMGMGFSGREAEVALKVTHGNVERALEYLLTR